MNRLIVTIDGRPYHIKVDLPCNDAETITAFVDGEKVDVFLPTGVDFSSEKIEWLVVNDKPIEFDYDSSLHWIKDEQGLHHIELKVQAGDKSSPGKINGRIKAPIPGRITQVLVTVGQKVECGQPVAILEAMKMLNELQAPRSGVVKSINTASGMDVSRGEIIVEIV
jgi:biotin carboxyl carrier protein